MNVAPPPGSLRPASPDDPLPVAEVSRARTLLGRIGDILLGKAATLLLASLALAVGLATFIILANGSPLGLRPGVSVGLVLANLSAILLLVAVLAGRLTRVWVERRRGSAGLAPACAAGSAVWRRGGGAGDHGGMFRGRLLPFRHPGLVQRAGA